jgi:hypothetical protein
VCHARAGLWPLTAPTATYAAGLADREGPWSWPTPECC